MLRSLSPAWHLTTPRYDFIFHITLPDSAIGSVHSLAPGLYDLSIPFKLHATSALQELKDTLVWGCSPLRFSMQPHSQQNTQGGLKQLAPSPKML